MFELLAIIIFLIVSWKAIARADRKGYDLESWPDKYGRGNRN